jgi:hypothetical protein
MKPLLLFFLASGLGGFCGGAEPPQVFRNFMPDAGPSAFGVVLGPELTLIYDPLRGGVNQVWRGTLDLAPTRRAKINEPAAVGGAVFYQEVMVQPLRVGSADAVPMRRFKGYRYEQDAVVFDYTLDGVLIRETMHAGADGGVERMLSAPPGTVLFYLAEPQGSSRLTITGAEEIRPGIWRHEAVEGSPLTLTIQPVEKP